MLFVVQCLDKPDGAELRAKTRPAHLDYLKTIADKVRIAGPLLDEGGEKPIGSLLILEAQDRAAAEALAAGDPYAKAGLFRKVAIAPWKWVIGKPRG